MEITRRVAEHWTELFIEGRLIKREFLSPKWCAPLCTIGCVHRVSAMDYWRKPQHQDPGVPQRSISTAS